MVNPFTTKVRAVIACGGTGGHLFPGMAVGRVLAKAGCEVCLAVSLKEVDQQAVRGIEDATILSLPAVGLTRGGLLSFGFGFSKALRRSRTHFGNWRPDLALAMGGFTSAPPVVAAKLGGAHCFLHESNSIPGRANRWLSPFVSESFIAFETAARRVHSRKKTLTGTPVRAQFFNLDREQCCHELGLDVGRPVIVVTGGSQGAQGVNLVAVEVAKRMAGLLPEVQWIHLSGAGNTGAVQQGYAAANITARVEAFSNRMHLLLGAATVAISRAGASSMAELAAARVPSVLIPYPAAMDNHQYYNGLAFSQTGAAYLVEQKTASAEALAGMIAELIKDVSRREQMKAALCRWSAPMAAEQIAAAMLRARGLTAMAEACLAPAKTKGPVSNCTSGAEPLTRDARNMDLPVRFSKEEVAV